MSSSPMVEQLVRDLAVVASAESLFTPTDVCGLASDDKVPSPVATARRTTADGWLPWSRKRHGSVERMPGGSLSFVLTAIARSALRRNSLRSWRMKLANTYC